MEMVKLHNLEDYWSLPMTKWNIKQPSADEGRENPLNTGKIIYSHHLNFIFITFFSSFSPLRFNRDAWSSLRQSWWKMWTW